MINLSTSTSRTSVPRTITQLARKQKLGRRSAAYGNGLSLSDIFSATFTLRLLGTVMFVFSGFFIYLGVTTGLSAYIAAVFFLLLSTSMFLVSEMSKRSYNKRVAASWLGCIYTVGCIIQQYKQNPQIFRWNEIEAIWVDQGSELLTGRELVESLRIQRADGYEMTLTRAGGSLNRLVEVINTRLSERLMSHALAQYSTGQMVVFGPCGLNREGFCLLEQDKKLLPWTHFARLEIKSGCLRLHEDIPLTYKDIQPDLWASIPTALIPNLAVLMELVEVARTDFQQQ